MKNIQVLLDSQCYTYLVTALNNMMQPIDSLKEEKVALVRSYLYGEIDISTTRTVKEEWLQIGDPENLNTHHVFEDLVGTVYPHNSSLNKMINGIIRDGIIRDMHPYQLFPTGIIREA